MSSGKLQFSAGQCRGESVRACRGAWGAASLALVPLGGGEASLGLGPKLAKPRHWRGSRAMSMHPFSSVRRERKESEGLSFEDHLSSQP